MNQLYLRIIVDLVIFAGIFIFPWWFPLVLAIFCLFLFKGYFEVFLVGFFLDILYGAMVLPFFKTNILFTIICAVAFLISFFAKRNLSAYSS